MRPTLPTPALTRSRIPEADAEAEAILHFAQTINGYEDAEPARLADLATRVESGEAEALSLHELRLALFSIQRAHYHQGGGWPGEVDTLLERMRALTATIRARVEAAGPTLGVWTGDITRLDVDAIVNAANNRLESGGGVDGAIHRAAGPELLKACMQFPVVPPVVRCPTGEARLTRGFGLPAGHVIHAVGPVWRGGEEGERALLASAYRESLSLATEAGFDSLAFPALSTGAYGFPKHEAARIAVDVIRRWQDAIGAPERVVLVAFDESMESILRMTLADSDQRRAG